MGGYGAFEPRPASGLVCQHQLKKMMIYYAYLFKKSHYFQTEILMVETCERVHGGGFSLFPAHGKKCGKM